MYRRMAAVALQLLLLTSAAVALPAPAAAEAAEHYLDQRVDLDCAEIATETGTLSFSLHLRRDAEAGASIVYTETGAELPTWVSAEPPSFRYSLDGLSLTAVLAVVRYEPEGPGTHAGDAVIAATLERSGPATEIDTASRPTNAWERIEGSVGPIVGSGTASFPDGTVVPFSGCTGTLALLDVFQTNPHALVRADVFTGTSCQLASRDGFAFVLVELRDEGRAFAEVLFVPSDPEGLPLHGGLEFTSSEMDRLEMLVPLEGTDKPAQLSLVLTTTGERATYPAISARYTLRVTEEILRAAGTLTFPGGSTFDLADCESTGFRTRLIRPDANDPGTRGNPATNDTIDRAITLEPGSVARNVWTGATANDPEMVCYGFEFGIGKTVWYRVEGTGSPITVDTAGSDFDTSMVVYEERDGELATLDCAGDWVAGRTPLALDLQARTTFETRAGATYYVQIGGWEDPHVVDDVAEFGRLTVRVR